MEKGSTGSAVVKSIVLVALAALIVMGLYLMFTRGKRSGGEETYDLTVVDEITTTNLEKNYPADPRKVVELYAKTMQTLYKAEYSKDQQIQMISTLAGIMDDELLANQGNFAQSIINEVNNRRENDYSIPSFVVQTKDPEEVTVNGTRMCDVDCLFSLRHGTVTNATYYQFVLRKDESGHWKILGWTLKEDE
ncbi:MAG: hypothetical protein K6G10_11980 [Butyrivibrio sp.]|nr:hypothetical protein [Butyrivibrio sp.]